MPQRSYIDLIRRYAAQPAKHRHHPKVGIFYPSGHDPDFHLPPPPPRPPMAKTLVPDGAPMHPVLGGGYRQHPLRTGEIRYVGHAQHATPLHREPVYRRYPRRS